MLAFLVPILGLGAAPTLVVLTFYAIYPILRSTTTGLQNVPPECQEAAEGLGFSHFQKIRFVELPLAFPTIMSGLRIASASTIGIATIAAFIGAGGLGDFIMEGLALNDSSLILLGAIPTAFLALGFDYGLSHLETHLSYQNKRPGISLSKKIFLSLAGLFIIFLGGNLYFKNPFTPKENSIVIASKNFTEQYILAELMAQLIEKDTRLTVIRKFNLGTTDIVHQALLQGEVDLYPEYTGTAYLTVLKESPGPNKKEVLQKVKSAYKAKFNLLWLEPFGFSNAQSLAVERDFAEKYHLTSLSDLAKISPSLKIAAPPEFLKRPDAFLGLSQAYGLKFKHILQVAPNLMYAALENKKVEIVAAFTTDANLQKHDLVPLKDDKNFYPLYQAAPVLRAQTLLSYPYLSSILSPLLGLITEEKMRALNYKVEGEGLSPTEVVREFLVEFDERPEHLTTTSREKTHSRSFK